MRSSRPPKPNWYAQIDGLAAANKLNEVAITIPLHIGLAFTRLGFTQPLGDCGLIFSEGHAISLAFEPPIAFACYKLRIVFDQ
jgi:hypothetical protein